MPSIVALRVIAGASLALGAVDLAWINLALAPAVTAPSGASAAAPRPAAVTAPPTAPPAPAAAIAPEVSPSPDAVPAPSSAPATAPGAVYFATSSIALDAAARDTIDALVAGAAPDAVFELRGHADYRGEAWRNRRLSRDRAFVVARHLGQLGIAAVRIRVSFAGEGPVVESGEWRDRRVDIEITGGAR